jgi:hypothetical protein
MIPRPPEKVARKEKPLPGWSNRSRGLVGSLITREYGSESEPKY